MTSCIGTYLFICWIFYCSPCVARNHFDNTWLFIKWLYHTPETATCKCCFLNIACCHISIPPCFIYTMLVFVYAFALLQDLLDAPLVESASSLYIILQIVVTLDHIDQDKVAKRQLLLRHVRYTEYPASYI